MAGTTLALQSGATKIASGGGHTCAIVTDGAVVCWGNNSKGQLGIGSFSPVTTTSAGAKAIASGATQIATGDEHTCALVENGTVKCWGRGDEGQHGWGTSNKNAPGTTLAIASGATHISAGYRHSCAVIANGAVNYWGYGRDHQLGTGSTANKVQALNTTAISSGATKVFAGQSHTCAVVQSGGVN